MPNFIRIGLVICKRYDKRYRCVVPFAIPTAVHLQNANAKFHKVDYRHYSGEVENDFIFVLCDDFTPDNMCQILSESVAFHRRHDKNILVCFFGSQCIDTRKSLSQKVAFHNIA